MKRVIQELLEAGLLSGGAAFPQGSLRGKSQFEGSLVEFMGFTALADR